ncbi:LysR family transcriptional regulator [Actinomadura rupiterrae]|uniref:LysR family transcriptional regulator n=1 Tax=Actinomadura rupiterrae TaxID=559627 RepID=UPI0020A2F386|nr:LysR family transcriptional regulator [Actinomadura rupiterrae]MCP2337436.1 DNA-binding transcriptional LysR family regulator [Actinomadura rupiterrae]
MIGRDQRHSGQNAPTAYQLHLFVTLAEELHFHRSAQRVFMSQGAFSQQISALERRLGLRLVERTTRRVSLTAAGAALLPYARDVVAASDHLLRAARRQQDAASQRIVIGAFEAITAVPPISDVINELRDRLDDPDIQIVRSGFAGAGQALLNGEVDAAFLALPVPDGIQTLPLASGPRCAVMASTDPLADKGPLTLADLADRPVVGFSPQVPKVFRDFWAIDPRPDGTPVQYTSHGVGDYESALSVIALGDGIEFVPTIARDLYPRPQVAYVEVSDLEPWTIALAWLPKNRDDENVAALRAVARAVAARR